MTKKKEDKKLTKDQAEKKILTLKKDLFNIRFKKVNNQINNPAQYNEIKKSIARLYTTIKNSKMTKKILKGLSQAQKITRQLLLRLQENSNILFMKKLLKDQKNIMHMMKKINLKEGEKVSIIECKPYSKKENLASNRKMIQIQTELTVADNTGAKRVECIKVLGGSKGGTLLLVI